MLRSVGRVSVRVLLALVPCTGLQAEDEASGRRAYEISDYFRTAFVGEPVVSPVGGRVAFSIRRHDLERHESWSEVWMMAADGSGLRQMTAGRHEDHSAAFSPDGSRLLFVSSRGRGAASCGSFPWTGGRHSS